MFTTCTHMHKCDLCIQRLAHIRMLLNFKMLGVYSWILFALALVSRILLKAGDLPEFWLSRLHNTT